MALRCAASASMALHCAASAVLELCCAASAVLGVALLVLPVLEANCRHCSVIEVTKTQLTYQGR